MSILQEYENIRKSLSSDTNKQIDEYLRKNPELFLSDLFYSPEQWEKFEKWMQSQKQITLKEFLNEFEFDYAIYVDENSKYSSIGLLDMTGANLGDIEDERYPLSKDGVKQLVDRLDIYYYDYKFSAIEEQLKEHKIKNVDSMSWEKMYKIDKEKFGHYDKTIEAIFNTDSILVEKSNVKKIKEQSQILITSQTKDGLNSIPTYMNSKLYFQGSLKDSKQYFEDIQKKFPRGKLLTEQNGKKSFSVLYPNAQTYTRFILDIQQKEINEKEFENLLKEKDENSQDMVKDELEDELKLDR